MTCVAGDLAIGSTKRTGASERKGLGAIAASVAPRPVPGLGTAVGSWMVK